MDCEPSTSIAAVKRGRPQIRRRRGAGAEERGEEPIRHIRSAIEH